MIEHLHQRGSAVLRRRLKAALMSLAILALPACVGFIPNDQLIASAETATARTSHAGCAPHWSTRPTGEQEAAGIDPTGFRLMSWNVHKAEDKDWPQDFARLSRRQDLILIQEAHLTPLFRSVLKDSRYHWAMARAFDYKGAETGVLTAGRVEPSAACVARISEPLIRLPKSSLLTRYRLENTGGELWVANIHGVNFTLGTGQFRHQLESLADVLVKHPGPMILAGDFNNWTKSRSDILHRITRRLRLEPLALAEDKRSRHLGSPVDLVFYRGVKVIQADSVEVSSSDHNPILVEFSVPKVKQAP